MVVLVLNCGSSTIKFEVIHTDSDAIAADAYRVLAKGVADLGGGYTSLRFEGGSDPLIRRSPGASGPEEVLEEILTYVLSSDEGIYGIGSPKDFGGVGHRVVHGGERFREAVVVDDAVLEEIEALTPLAPLHNPSNVGMIRAAMRALGPEIPNVAVFDTAFHSTLPERAYLYAVPSELRDRYGFRRYGFHGTSHRYSAHAYGRLTGLSPGDVNIITLHLGSGCSACAIRGGVSVDTSMGFTPMEGLVMSTRCGDIDPSVVLWLEEKTGLTREEAGRKLNYESGLLGLSGISGDMRVLLDRAAENPAAESAISVFCYRAKKYVGSYYAALGGADALVFTGGIGENAPRIRARVCEGLDSLGLELDPLKNESVRFGEISSKGSRFKAYVIPAREELMIARDTFRLCGG